jgi:haloacid dehalogenase superfamily, subfamily IA, variant 3 with third motif having DD or ED
VPEPHDAVLLDLYDTIVWSEWFRLRDAIAARIGNDMEADRLQEAFEQTRPARGVGEFDGVDGDMAAVLQAAGVAYDTTLVGELVELERAHLENGVRLYDDVLPALASLRERGVKTALVSNCSHSTRPVVERLGLETAFDRVVLSFEVRAMKPDPAIYKATLEQLGGVAPERAVFVDDQPSYCDGATAIGIDARLILRKNEDVPADQRGRQVVTDLAWLL